MDHCGHNHRRPTTWIAAKGYGMVSQAANWMSPVIVMAFLACGVVASNQLGIQSFSDFIAVWGRDRNLFPDK